MLMCTHFEGESSGENMVLYTCETVNKNGWSSV